MKDTSPETAGALEEIATSSSYGAPARRETPIRSTPRPKDLGPDRSPETSVPTAFESAGAIAAASVSDTRLVGLLAALFATTLGAVALAIRRARVEAR